MKTDPPAPLRATPFVLETPHGSTDCMRLETSDGATAVVSLHGAQVLSWIPPDGRERLFLGSLADFAPGSAIRGGIPVIFPQFAARGPLVKHGFARTAVWRVDGLSEDATAACFVLRDDHGTRAQWPHAFLARVLVSLHASALDVGLEITNKGATSFDFTCALHTYLRVDALQSARLDGVADASYIDSANGGAIARERDAPLIFDREIDRIHVGSRGDKTLHDGADATDSAITIGMQGFTDTVVWNPGDTLAATMADVAPGEYRHFVCVEPACIEPPVNLAAQTAWHGSLRLTALSRGDLRALEDVEVNIRG